MREFKQHLCVKFFLPNKRIPLCVQMNQIATESQPADFKTAAFMNGQRARSTKSLKSLAFQTAAILRWRIKVIANELPIASCNKLVTTFVTHCGINLPLHVS